MGLRSKLRKFRRRFFPTAFDREIARWFADRGDETLRLDYPLTPESVVVDLGGYKGEWAARIHERYGSTVHVFEPVQAFCDTIARRFAGNAKVTAHPVALAASDREETIHLARDGSSALRDGAPKAAGSEVTAIFREFGAYLIGIGVERIDLLKINIEGGEYELLDHLVAAGLMRNVRFLQVQFHHFVADAAARMRSIQSGLEATHHCDWRYTFVWEGWSRRNEALSKTPNHSA